MKEMEKNEIYSHLQKIHKVTNRKFDQIPVIGKETEDIIIVTTAGSLDLKKTGP